MWGTRKFKETAVNTLIASVETFGIDNGDRGRSEFKTDSGHIKCKRNLSEWMTEP